MTETLFHAYTPLIIWTSVGLLMCRFIPQSFPRILGRGLFWFGVPLQLLALARRTNISEMSPTASLPTLVPFITFGALSLGLAIASLIFWLQKRFFPTSALLEPGYRGSFLLAAVIGNTGFVGLALAPSIINPADFNWALFYSITHNLIGTYGFGVVIASSCSHAQTSNRWWMKLRDVLTVPSLWAFLLGYLTQSVPLPEPIESGLQASVELVIAAAFLLTGIRLAQLQGWKSLKLGLIPAVVKVVIVPALVGISTTLFLGLSGDQRLAMVLMSGMPSAFAGLILAEEYNLNRDLVASSIILSTLLLLLVLPLWIVIFD